MYTFICIERRRVSILIVFLISVLVVCHGLLVKHLLLRGIDSGDATMVKIALVFGANPNLTYVTSSSYHGTTYYGSPLSRAALAGRVDIVDQLTQSGAILSAGKKGSRKPKNPFGIAVVKNNIKLIDHFMISATKDGREGLVSWGLSLPTNDALSDSVGIENSVGCYTLVDKEIPRGSYHWNVLESFFHIAKNYASDEQLTQVYRRPILNNRVLNYLFERKVWPTTKEAAELYTGYPMIIESLVDGGFDIDRKIDGETLAHSISGYKRCFDTFSYLVDIGVNLKIVNRDSENPIEKLFYNTGFSEHCYWKGKTVPEHEFIPLTHHKSDMRFYEYLTDKRGPIVHELIQDEVFISSLLSGQGKRHNHKHSDDRYSLSRKKP